MIPPVNHSPDEEGITTAVVVRLRVARAVNHSPDEEGITTQDFPRVSVYVDSESQP